MDANRWLLGLILTLEMRVRLELDSVHYDAARLSNALDEEDAAGIASEREEALKGVRYIKQQCDTLLSLAATAPDGVQADPLIR